jgi:hypothetical protein
MIFMTDSLYEDTFVKERRKSYQTVLARRKQLGISLSSASLADPGCWIPLKHFDRKTLRQLLD